MSKLRKIAKENAFVITSIGYDRLEARFVKPPRNVESLAKRIAKLAPDVIKQGTDTIERLEQYLTKQKSYRLWWD